MDEARTAAVLRALAEALPDDVLLWRGEGLDGGDIDVVVLTSGTARVSRVLRECGLAPAPQDPGRVLWRALPAKDVVIDVLTGHAWPRMYPPLSDVAARSERGTRGLPVASPGDRMLIHAAEALAGWSRPKTAAKLEACSREPDAARSLERATRDDPGLAALVPVVSEIGQPPEERHRDRLPLRTVARTAQRSRYARHALRSRLVGEPTARPAATTRPERPLLIALSGMDGAGKSSACLALLDRFDEREEAASVHWTRLARDLGLLHHVARGARRLMRRTGSVSNPYRPEDQPDDTSTTNGARESSAEQSSSTQSGAGSRPGVVDAVWVAGVALSSVRNGRRAARLRRTGTHVICDRWVLDALVDLRIRYGRHRLAEWVLRRGYPRPDVAVLLRVGAEAAAARKPGDQRPDVLRAMSEHYALLGPDTGVTVLDAGRPSGEVLDDLHRLVADR